MPIVPISQVFVTVYGDHYRVTSRKDPCGNQGDEGPIETRVEVLGKSMWEEVEDFEPDGTSVRDETLTRAVNQSVDEIIRYESK